MTSDLRVQDRDGCRSQVGALRDKVSALSRDLAAHEDADVNNAEALRGLRAQLAGSDEACAQLRAQQAADAAALASARADAEAAHAEAAEHGQALAQAQRDAAAAALQSEEATAKLTQACTHHLQTAGQSVIAESEVWATLQCTGVTLGAKTLWSAFTKPRMDSPSTPVV